MDNILSSLVECIQNEDDNESFYVLRESLEEINELRKSLKQKDTSAKGIFNKVKNSCDSVLRWYFKVEPEKKYKTFHSVLKIFSMIILQLISTLNMYLGIRNAKNKTSSPVNRHFIFSAIMLVIDTLKKMISEKMIIKYNVYDYDKNKEVMTKVVNKIDEEINNIKQKDKLYEEDEKYMEELIKIKVEYNKTLDELKNVSVRHMTKY